MQSQMQKLLWHVPENIALQTIFIMFLIFFQDFFITKSLYNSY